MKENKTANDYIQIYKEQLEKEDIQIAYNILVKYMLSLKAHFTKTFSDKYTCGNVSPGYMDFTYFPFFNEYLRNNKLRFGIVLNHKEMKFELWLMGQNAEVQENYWDLLKDTKWNVGQVSMPKYSVLEAVLVHKPNFNDLDSLTLEIENTALHLTEEILKVIK